MALLFSNNGIYCISFVYEEQWGIVFLGKRMGDLYYLIVSRVRRSVNVIINPKWGVVVETYVNGGNSTAGSCPDGRVRLT